MNTIVTTSHGKISGAEQDSYVVYKGIPYAKPPVGKLRWKAPEPADAWESVFEAVEFSAKCPQNNRPYGFYGKEFYDSPEYKREMAEDCLYLNIWAPKDGIGDGSKQYPVAFYIHGGGFSSGYSSEIEFDGEEYCRRGVILVTINYRLGIYGFLAHPWLSAENEKGISGNYGILDQIMALTWVYENIGAFGGDPHNITVFGQSAGCMSAQVLASSQLTKNMIRKVIFQSGFVYKYHFHYMPTLEEEMEIGKEWAETAGVKTIEELRALTTEQIETASGVYGETARKKKLGIVIVPNVDGYVLGDTVNRLVESGSIKDIPYMVGTVAKDLGVTPEQLAAHDRGELARDAERFSLHLESIGRNPAYVYYFSHELPGDDRGAFHSAELWYTFGTLGRCWRPMKEEDYRLSEEMLDCWTHFMKTGRPTEDDKWKPCTKAERFVKEFR